jgi:hypothetical protein
VAITQLCFCRTDVDSAAEPTVGPVQGARRLTREARALENYSAKLAEGEMRRETASPSRRTVAIEDSSSAPHRLFFRHDENGNFVSEILGDVGLYSGSKGDFTSLTDFKDDVRALCR